MAPVNLTKIVNDNIRRGAAIAEDVAVHGKTLPARVAEALGQPRMEAVLTEAFELGAVAQADAEAALRDADYVHLEEQTDDARLRADRDQTAAVLYSSITRTRGLVESTLGRDALREVGFVGETPTDAVSLSRLAPLVVAKVEKLTVPADELVQVNFAGLASEIAKAHAPLAEVMKATQTDLRENEATLRARNEKLAASTKRQDFMLDLLRLCASFLGDADLNHRLRPNTPRASIPAPAPVPELPRPVIGQG